MADLEKARKMLQAIEEKRRGGEIDEDTYQILREKWTGILEGSGTKVEAEVGKVAVEGEMLPPHAEDEDVGSLTIKLLGEFEGSIKQLRGLRKRIEGEIEERKHSLQKIDKALRGLQSGFRRRQRSSSSALGLLKSRKRKSREK